MKKIICAFIAIALMATSVLIRAAQPLKPERGLHISVMVFSGREDPKFIVTDPKEIAEILSAVRGLPAHGSLNSDSSLPHPMFGFRGVTIQNFSSITPELGFVHIYGTDVEMIESSPASSAKTKSFRLDNTGALQQRLLNIARAKGVYPPK